MLQVRRFSSLIFRERKKERKITLKPESSANFETPVSDSVKEIQDNATNGQDFMEKCEEDMFMASLVCNVDAECEKLLVCVTELHCVKTLQFEMEEICNFGRFVESAASTGNVSVMYVVDLTMAAYYQSVTIQIVEVTDLHCVQVQLMPFLILGSPRIQNRYQMT
ncbi:hypothetical protein SDJN03_28091, partial [Cucurbita argyrosperma subsp. sororia]